MEESQMKFSEDHLWVLEMGETARFGLSDYAQEQLGEIVSVTHAEIGKFIEPGDMIGELESQKTVVELVSPITGTIKELKVSPGDTVHLKPFSNRALLFDAETGNRAD